VFFAPGKYSAQGVAEDYDVPVVKRALEDRFPPGQGFFGITEKQLNRLGDRVAIALLKILDDEDLKNPQKVKRALQIVHHSFLYPRLISIVQDKKPNVTLVLLDYINSKTSDPILKKEISVVIKFVKEKTGSVSRN